MFEFGKSPGYGEESYDEIINGKSASAISFDAYGNLVTTEKATANLVSDLTNLEDLDYIVQSFESTFRNDSPLPEIPVKHRPLSKKSETTTKKLRSSNDILPERTYTEKDLEQAFKVDYDIHQSTISRYGRSRKQKKSHDGFLFGTLNFNQLRKIGSPKKKSSTNLNLEHRSDNESLSSQELLQTPFSLINKNSGYSSEDEFQNLPLSELVTKKRKCKSAPKRKRSKTPSSESDSSKKKTPKSKRHIVKLGSIINITDSTKTKNKISSSVKNGKVTQSPSNKMSTKKMSPKKENKLSPKRKTRQKSGENKNEEKFSQKRKLETDTLDERLSRDKKVKVEYVESEEENYSKMNSLLCFEQLKSKSLEDDLKLINTPVESLLKEKMLENSQAESNIQNTKIKSKSLVDSNNIKNPEIKPDLDIKKEEQQSNSNNVDEVCNGEETSEKDAAISTKFGRTIKKTVLMDMSQEDKREKEAKQKQEANVMVVEDSNLESEKDEQPDFNKEFPVKYFIGDLVWVNIKGSPLWPAIIAYPEDETNYTKVTGASHPYRLYHVQFFCDNNQRNWVHAMSLLAFEGYEKLLAYLEEVKEAVIKKTVEHTMKVRSKFMLKALHIIKKMQDTAKSRRWKQATQEAETLLSLSRYDRLKENKASIDKELEEQRLKKLAKKSHPNEPKLSKKKESNNNGKDEEFCGFSNTTAIGGKDYGKDIGDFRVYLQTHLDNTLKEDTSLGRAIARKQLRMQWSKLTLLERAKYTSEKKSKAIIYYEREFIDSEEPESANTSIRGSCSRRKSQHAAEEDSDSLEEVPKGTYKLVRNERVCCLCESACSKSANDVIKCKGVCNNHFHKGCLGLSASPTEFKCAECLSGQHPCFICSSSMGDVIRCSISNCGKFYHLDCVNKWPQTSKARFEKLVCPRHVCHMCAANADDMLDVASRTQPFTRCIRCPTTYHTGEDCISAGSDEITTSHHLCTKHIELPKGGNIFHCNVNWCFCCSKGGSLMLCDQCPAAFHAECMDIKNAPEEAYICEDCENGKLPAYGDIVWVKVGNYRWWPGEVMHPKFIPDNIENLSHKQGMFCVHFFGSDDYYWVTKGRAFHYQEGDQGSKVSGSKTIAQKFNKALQDAAEAYAKQKERRTELEKYRALKGNMKPAPYVKIDTNKPVGSVRLGKLDLSTVNKCDCDPFSDNPCGSDERCLNRMLMVECIPEVCNAKDRCGNNRFQKRLYPNVSTFRTKSRGWGLKTNEFIKKGAFVIEYVGELIDDAELRKRIDRMHDIKEENYYFLTIDKDRIIDAGPKGNLSRFMNHSCDPNCETQKWTVGADTRVGLFAMYDIEPGFELTFNYNLECVGTDKKACHCGGPNCSGFIGAKAKNNEISNCKKSVTIDKRKKKKKVRKKRKDTENVCFRCGTPGELILCDLTLCPKGYHVECLKLESAPKGKWLCPWHHCDECGSRSSNRCILCPNSFCRFHTNGKFHSTPGLGNVCSEHETDEIQAFRGQMETAAVGLQSLPEKLLQTKKEQSKTDENNSNELQYKNNSTKVIGDDSFNSNTIKGYNTEKKGNDSTEQDISTINRTEMQSQNSNITVKRKIKDAENSKDKNSLVKVKQSQLEQLNCNSIKLKFSHSLKHEKIDKINIAVGRISQEFVSSSLQNKDGQNINTRSKKKRSKDLPKSPKLNKNESNTRSGMKAKKHKTRKSKNGSKVNELFEKFSKKVSIAKKKKSANISNENEGQKRVSSGNSIEAFVSPKQTPMGSKTNLNTVKSKRNKMPESQTKKMKQLRIDSLLHRDVVPGEGKESNKAYSQVTCNNYGLDSKTQKVRPKRLHKAKSSTIAGTQDGHMLIPTIDSKTKVYVVNATKNEASYEFSSTSSVCKENKISNEKTNNSNNQPNENKNLLQLGNVIDTSSPNNNTKNFRQSEVVTSNIPNNNENDICLKEGNIINGDSEATKYELANKLRSRESRKNNYQAGDDKNNRLDIRDNNGQSKEGSDKKNQPNNKEISVNSSDRSKSKIFDQLNDNSKNKQLENNKTDQSKENSISDQSKDSNKDIQPIAINKSNQDSSNHLYERNQFKDNRSDLSENQSNNISQLSVSNNSETSNASDDSHTANYNLMDANEKNDLVLFKGKNGSKAVAHLAHLSANSYNNSLSNGSNVTAGEQKMKLFEKHQDDRENVPPVRVLRGRSTMQKV